MIYQFFKTIDLSQSVAHLGWPASFAGAITPVLTDLNHDGQLDVVFHLSQGQTEANWGALTDAPTPNQLIAFTSQPDGSYTDQSRGLFAGEDSLSLPGMSRKVATADLNQDGWLDWVYALNREDGRAGTPASTNTAQAAAVISRADGTYGIQELGSNNWYHSVLIDHLTYQKPMVILSGYYSGPGFGSNSLGYNLGGGYGYTWSAQQQAFDTGTAMPAHANTAVSFRSPTGGAQILSVIENTSGAQQLGLFELKAGNWVMHHSIAPYASTVIPFVTYSLDKGTAELFQIAPGVYGAAAGYSESKPIALFPGDVSTSVFKFSAAVITAPRADGYYHQNDGVSLQILDFYRTAGTVIEKLPITVMGEDQEVNANFLDVLDFNGDGLEDVVVYPYANGGQPCVYLNTGGNVMVKVDQALFPVAPAEWGMGASSKFADLNSDGVLDLLYAPMNGFSLADPTQLLWQTYLGDHVYDATSIDANVRLTDRLGTNTIRTWAGDDTVSDLHHSVSTWIDMGTGKDVATYSGAAWDYQLEVTASKVLLRKSDTLQDTLVHVEKLQFNDKSVTIESKAHGSYADLPAGLYQFFMVAFGAAPGVTYMDQLAEAYRYGLSVKQIVDIFTTKTQFTSVYPSTLNTRDLAAALINNIVKDSATAANKAQAIDDIQAAMAIGWTVGDVIYQVFGNLARKPLADAAWGQTALQFNNEVAVAKFYTEVLNQSTTDMATLRDVLDGVTPTTDVSTEEAMAQLIGVALMTGGLAGQPV